MHNHILHIDTIAQTSKLNAMNPGLKIGVGLLSLIFCVSSESFLFHILIAGIMIGVVLKNTKLNINHYMKLMWVPSLFIILSSIALLVQLSRAKLGFFDVSVAGWYVSITKDSLSSTFTVIIRAYASITCLFMISLTTPIADVIYVCRRIKIPEIMIELMYLIYRFIMILFDVHSKMTIAADSRLGYMNLNNTYTSMKGIASNLLSLAFKRASTSFDAMESRGYIGKLNFYREEKPLQKKEIILTLIYLFVIGFIFLYERKSLWRVY